MSQQGHMNPEHTHEPTATHATRSYAIIKPSNDESKSKYAFIKSSDENQSNKKVLPAAGESMTSVFLL